MSKAELVSRIANRIGMSKAQTKEILDVVLEEIRLCARNGKGSLNLRPLGTFKLKHRAARTGRNPRTGETIKIEARDVLTFKESN